MIKKYQIIILINMLFLILVLGYCQTSQSDQANDTNQDTQEQEQPSNSNAIIIELSPEICEKPGRNVPNGEIPTPKDLAIDAYCADLLIKEQAPNGYVTMFGSARAKEDMKRYQDAMTFAKLWTEKYGEQYPILTGGGPGIMEAGNKGAMEAGGPSLSFASYFGSGSEKPNEYTTDGYMFASFSQREAEMVDRAAALVVCPGGIGTEWEIFETLAKIQTDKKAMVPVVLLGSRKLWQTLFDRLNHLSNIGTISPEDIDILQVAETPQQAVEIIESGIINIAN